MKATAIIACLLLTGCYTLRAPSSTESAWLALHAIDTAQTITIARSPTCLHEKDPLAQLVYGTRHPSVKRVLVTNLIGAAVHWAASGWLERKGPEWLHSSYLTVSVGYSGSAIGNNLVRGIRPFSGYTCGPQPTPRPGPPEFMGPLR